MTQTLTVRTRQVLLAAFVVVGALAGLVAIGGQQLVVEDGRPALTALDGPTLPDDVAFSIGDDEVTRTQLQDAVDVLSGLYGIAAPDDPDQADTFRRDTAKAIAVSRILAADAVGRGIEVTDEQVEQQLTALVDSAYGGDRDTFVSTLGDKGVSEDDVRTEIRNQLQNVQLFSQVTESAAAPTEAELQAYYDGHRDELVDPARRVLANIVVADEAAARQALQQLQAGTQFGPLARQVSLDAQTRDKGGFLGRLSQAELEPTYAQAAFAAELGKPFGPVQTQSGWNVGLARSEDPARPLTFAEAKESIGAQLLDDARQKLWNDFLVKTIAAADVEYADEFRPNDPDAPPADDLGVPGASPSAAPSTAPTGE